MWLLDKYQSELIQQINVFNLETLPNSICFIGKRGSGKHTLCDYLSDRLNIAIEDITDSLSLNLVYDIMLSAIHKFYLVNSEQITEKQESVLLKILEEPVRTAHFIIIAEDKSHVMSTILNRCVVFYFKPYSKQTLQEIATTLGIASDNQHIIVEYGDTIGDLILLNSDLKDMCSLALSIFKNICKANPANCLVLRDKVKLSANDVKGFDADLFFKVLLHTAADCGLNTYILTKDFVAKTKIPRVRKDLLFESYLLELKALSTT